MGEKSKSGPSCCSGDKTSVSVTRWCRLSSPESRKVVSSAVK